MQIKLPIIGIFYGVFVVIGFLALTCSENNARVHENALASLLLPVYAGYRGFVNIPRFIRWVFVWVIHPIMNFVGRWLLWGLGRIRDFIVKVVLVIDWGLRIYFTELGEILRCCYEMFLIVAELVEWLWDWFCYWFDVLVLNPLRLIWTCLYKLLNDLWIVITSQITNIFIILSKFINDMNY